MSAVGEATGEGRVLGSHRLVGRAPISWGAIFGGAVAAFALWLLLYAFGLAVGLTTIDASDTGSLRPSGIFTGIWALISPLVALFVGGYVAGRSAGVATRGEGASHGLIMWGLTTLIGAFLVANLLGAVIGGVASVGRAAVQAGGQAAGAAFSGARQGAGPAAQYLGIDANDALRPINERLAAEGKPTITPQQLENATKDVVQRGLREGRLDQPLLTQSIAQNTNLSQADAQQIAARLEGQFAEARGRIEQRIEGAADAAQTGALKAAEASGKAFWGVFGALLLGLIAAVVGGLLGAPGRRRRDEQVQRREVVTQGRMAPPQEVYP